MKWVSKILLTPIVSVFGFACGLMAGLIAFIYIPIDLVTKCLIDLWEN